MRSDESYGNNGVFLINTGKHRIIKIVVSDQLSWDHVSVSLPNRCPTWREMCLIKDLFFLPEETVIQYHPPESIYVNDNEFVLHMWRPQGVHFPMPPIGFV
jgi:hypothetical protein